MCRILVVDNDPVIKELVEQFLTDHNTTLCTNVDDAVGLFTTITPDVCIVSMQMEEFKGLSLIHSFADQGCGVQPRRLVALTDTYNPENVNAAFSAGCTDIMPKPLQPIFVQSRIRDMAAWIQLFKTQKAMGQKWDSLISLFPDPVTITKYSSGEYIHVNQSFIDRLGKPIEAVIGKTPIELGILAQQDREKFLKALSVTGRVVDYNLVYNERGVPRSVSISAQVLDSDIGRFILAVSRDMTDYKEMLARNEILRKTVKGVEFRQKLAEGISRTRALKTEVNTW